MTVYEALRRDFCRYAMALSMINEHTSINLINLETTLKYLDDSSALVRPTTTFLTHIVVDVFCSRVCSAVNGNPPIRSRLMER